MQKRVGKEGKHVELYRDVLKKLKRTYREFYCQIGCLVFGLHSKRQWVWWGYRGKQPLIEAQQEC